MSRLVNPGVGEIVDRLGILSLKLLHAEQANPSASVDHFRREHEQLLAMLRGRTLNGSWFPLAIDLTTTNAALWRAEDDLRRLRNASEDCGQLVPAGVIGFRIQALNDARNRLIGEINRAVGEFYGEEKL